MRKQSGRLIELQILVAAVFMAVVIFIAQVAGDQGFMKSLLVSAGTVIGVIAALVGLAFIGILPGEIREWYTTPVAVRAARKKNALEALRKIRPDRFDAQAADRFGDTALHVVCDSYEEERKRGAAEIVDFLLHQAAKYGTADMIRELLARGAEINARDRDGTTPLHDALWMPSLDERGTAENVTALVAARADRDAKDNQGRTPRALAEESGAPTVIAAMNGISAEPLRRPQS